MNDTLTRRERSQFYRMFWSLVIPITLQSLINSAVNSADVFMLGYVSQAALSAVSLANQIQFLVTGFFWGATSGTALMVAQYWGKGDTRSIQTVMGIGFRLSLAFTALMAAAAIGAPKPIMRLLTDDEELIAIGALYLRILGVSYILQSLSQIYGAAMKSMGRAGVITTISMIALGLNVVLNALFIFGWLGFPKLGVAGVAIATVIARVIETLLCVGDAVKSRFIRYEAKLILGHGGALTKDFFRFSLPALANDLSWTAAFSTYSIILGHLGSDAVAASAVATTIRDLCTVLCMSLGQAAVAIIGMNIGAGEPGKARQNGRRFVILSLVFGAATGLLILLMRPFIGNFFRLSDEAHALLKFMLLISSYYVIGQSVNTTVITGVFRAGGDTKFGMICDTVNMWCIAVPLGFLSAFALKLPVKAVYFILCLDEFYKLPVEYIHYKKYGWLKDLTRDDTSA